MVRIDSASSLNRVVANANLSRFDRRRVASCGFAGRTAADGLRRHEGLISARRTDVSSVAVRGREGGRDSVGMGMKCRTN